MLPSRIWQLTARKMTQDITLEELQELEQLLRDDPQLNFQLEMHGRYFNTLDEVNENELENAWQRQLNMMKTETKKMPRPGKRRTWAIAAAAVILPILCYYSWQYAKKDAAMPLAQITAYDNKHEVVLPDGTKVTLNKKSNIYLSKGFGKTNRNIRLEGEAFFDVAHNPQLPMTIHAATVQIKVIGTAFNVRAYDDEKKVETALIRGKIEITDEANKQIKILLNPNDKITIDLEHTPLHNTGTEARSNDPGYLYKMGALHNMPASSVIPEIAWMEDKLAFNSETMEEVAKKLEKWYNVSITIRSDKLAKEKFTGVFEDVPLIDALTALQLTYTFQFKIDGTTITITE